MGEVELLTSQGRVAEALDLRVDQPFIDHELPEARHEIVTHHTRTPSGGLLEMRPRMAEPVFVPACDIVLVQIRLGYRGMTRTKAKIRIYIIGEAAMIEPPSHRSGHL